MTDSIEVSVPSYDDDDKSALAASRLTKLRKRLNASAWNDELEDLMQCWGEKAAGNRELHDTSASLWKRFGEKLTLPVIVLTTIGGVSNFGAANVEDPQFWMYTIGSINIIAAMIASLSKFYKAEEKAQLHSSTARNFGSFFRNMTIELGLSREDRMNSEELCRWAKHEYDRIQSEAPSIPGRVVAQFKKKHGDHRNLPDLASDHCEINIYGRPTVSSHF